MKFLNVGLSIAKQISILMMDNVIIKVFLELRPLLGSNQVAEKAFRQSLAFLKQYLED